MAVIWQLKWLLYQISSHLYSASGAQTVPKVHASAALLAAHLSMTAGSTREKSSCLATALRPVVRHLTAPSVLHLESACGRASSSAQVLPLFLRTVCISSLFRNLVLMKMCAVSGETRRILSVNPTYDWTCFSYALLNVSPMQVESSPPMPCPPPCHSLQNCSLCLGSRGSDGGWQHCVWSMALQQVRWSQWSLNPFVLSFTCSANVSVSLVHEPVFRAPSVWSRPVRPPTFWGGFLHSTVLTAHPVFPVHLQASVWVVCRSGGKWGWSLLTGRTWWWKISSFHVSTHKHFMLRSPWVLYFSFNFVFVLLSHFPGVSEGVCPLRNSSWSFLHCPEEDECANGHHHCNSTQDCHDLPQGFHCTCKQGYILSRYEQRSACMPQSLNTERCFKT